VEHAPLHRALTWQRRKSKVAALTTPAAFRAERIVSRPGGVVVDTGHSPATRALTIQFGKSTVFDAQVVLW
jgi:hypothetical protein